MSLGFFVRNTYFIRVVTDLRGTRACNNMQISFENKEFLAY
jgi:hypothetical protein